MKVSQFIHLLEESVIKNGDLDLYFHTEIKNGTMGEVEKVLVNGYNEEGKIIPLFFVYGGYETNLPFGQSIVQ